MSKLLYPSRATLKRWVEYLRKRPTVFSYRELPFTDEAWLDAVVAVIDLLQLPYYGNKLHAQGAQLFYKIIKDHFFVDGNKRSAVITIYLFYLVNGCILVNSPDDMLLIAEETARSFPDDREPQIQKLEKLLNKLCHKVR